MGVEKLEDPYKSGSVVKGPSISKKSSIVY